MSNQLKVILALHRESAMNSNKIVPAEPTKNI